MRHILFFSLVLIGLFSSSCKKGLPVNIEKEFDNQAIPLNAPVTKPLTIRALNHKGEAIEGLKVRFFIKNGSGIFEGNTYETTTTTDEAGYAKCIFYMGKESVPQQIEAEIEKYEDAPVIFTVLPEYAKDSRDSEKYLLTKIGDKVWTAQNIRYSSAGSRANPDYPSTIYGRLYNWYDAQTACPAGFRLPLLADYEALAVTIGNQNYTIGKKLKARSGWYYLAEGKNLSGFELYPAGNFLPSMGEYRGLGEYATLWGSDEQDNLNGKYAILSYNSTSLLFAYYAKSTPTSCRCIRT